jgi:hypothetical protein
MLNQKQKEILKKLKSDYAYDIAQYKQQSKRGLIKDEWENMSEEEIFQTLSVLSFSQNLTNLIDEFFIDHEYYTDWTPKHLEIALLIMSVLEKVKQDIGADVEASATKQEYAAFLAHLKNPIP